MYIGRGRRSTGSYQKKPAASRVRSLVDATFPSELGTSGEATSWRQLRACILLTMTEREGGRQLPRGSLLDSSLQRRITENY